MPGISGASDYAATLARIDRPLADARRLVGEIEVGAGDVIGREIVPAAVASGTFGDVASELGKFMTTHDLTERTRDYLRESIGGFNDARKALGQLRSLDGQLTPQSTAALGRVTRTVDDAWVSAISARNAIDDPRPGERIVHVPSGEVSVVGGAGARPGAARGAGGTASPLAAGSVELAKARETLRQGLVGRSELYSTAEVDRMLQTIARATHRSEGEAIETVQAAASSLGKGWTTEQRADVIVAAVESSRPAIEVKPVVERAIGVFANGWSDSDKLRLVDEALRSAHRKPGNIAPLAVDVMKHWKAFTDDVRLERAIDVTHGSLPNAAEAVTLYNNVRNQFSSWPEDQLTALAGASLRTTHWRADDAMAAMIAADDATRTVTERIALMKQGLQAGAG